MKLRPSSLPMLQKCALFESSSEDSDFASSGTARHAYLTSLFSDKIPTALNKKSDDNAQGESAAQSPDADAVGSAQTVNQRTAQILSDEEKDAVEWAADYIRVHAPMSDHPIDFERRLTLSDSDFNEILAGTPDVVCGADLFDLKWRRRDYTAQMAAYALMMFENNSGLEIVRVHILFGESQWAERFNLTKESAEKIVYEIVNKTKSASEPTPNEYCGWCANRLSCKAFTDRAAEVVAARDDWKLGTYHTSQIETPEEMSKALRVARLLKNWCEAVEFHAEKMAIAKGFEIPGFVIKERKGRTFVSDVTTAFSLSGISQEKFLSACEVRLNSSKTYKEKIGLTELYAEVNGMKLASAKKQLLANLAPVITTGKSSKYLAAVNQIEGE